LIVVLVVVTCTAEDLAGNTAQESSQLQDTTAPDIEITKAADEWV
jgi:hypothetical protein